MGTMRRNILHLSTYNNFHFGPTNLTNERKTKAENIDDLLKENHLIGPISIYLKN